MDTGGFTFTKQVVDKEDELERLEKFKQMVEDKERSLQETQSKMDLSDFSTTQLKAELRRRKKERRGYM